MKIFKFNKEKLDYEQIKFGKWLIMGIMLFIGIGFLSSFIAVKEQQYIQTEKEIKLTTDNSFSKEKLIEEMKHLNIKHPHIVYAQFVLESNHFKSRLFLTQNNLMGMQESTSRPSTNVGSDNGFAVYNSWRDSVLDYALYQASFMRGINEQQYFEYLSKNYAEDKEYVKKLKNYIKNSNIKKEFK